MMKLVSTAILIVIAGPCAALRSLEDQLTPTTETDRVVAQPQLPPFHNLNAHAHVLQKLDGLNQPRMASIEPAYLDDYIITLKHGVSASEMRDLLSLLKRQTADHNAPNFHAHVEDEDIHEEMGVFTAVKPSVEAVEMLKAYDLVLDVERDQLAFTTGMRPANVKEAVKTYLRSKQVRSAKAQQQEQMQEQPHGSTQSSAAPAAAAPAANRLVGALDFCDDNLYQWGLDRIDQRDNTLDCSVYDPVVDTADGDNVRIYIIDTGLQTDHSTWTDGFADRQVRMVKDFYPGSGTTNNNDVDGHGTHVASSAAGHYIGVASKADLHSIKALTDNGSGSYTIIRRALNLVLTVKRRQERKPMVINMSLGGGASTSLDRAVNTLADAGVPVVVAAGNDFEDACDSSPSRAAQAITVAASEEDGTFASYSNYGPCVDVIAPGSEILAACSDLSISGCVGGQYYIPLDGTSMASPHVAGLIALYLRQANYPGASASPSPELMKKVLHCCASKDKISNVPTGTVNDLVYTPDAGVFDQATIDCINA